MKVTIIKKTVYRFPLQSNGLILYDKDLHHEKAKATNKFTNLRLNNG